MDLHYRLKKKIEEDLDKVSFQAMFDIIEETGLVEVTKLVDITIMLSIVLEDNPDMKLRGYIERLQHLSSSDECCPPLSYYESLYLIAEFERIVGLKRKRSDNNLYL